MIHVGGDVYVIVDSRNQVCSVHATWDGAFDRIAYLQTQSSQTYSIAHRLLKE